MQKPGVGEVRAKLGQVDRSEFFIRCNRQLECGAFQMINENLEIVWLNVSVFGRAFEEVFRMLHDELIEGCGRRNHDRTGSSVAAASATRALPGGRNGSRVPGHHARIERADIDAQFERAGGNDTSNAAFAQTAFYYAPFAR